MTTVDFYEGHPAIHLVSLLITGHFDWLYKGGTVPQFKLKLQFVDLAFLRTVNGQCAASGGQLELLIAGRVKDAFKSQMNRLSCDATETNLSQVGDKAHRHSVSSALYDFVFISFQTCGGSNKASVLVEG